MWTLLSSFDKLIGTDSTILSKLLKWTKMTFILLWYHFDIAFFCTWALRQLLYILVNSFWKHIYSVIIKQINKDDLCCSHKIKFSLMWSSRCLSNKVFEFGSVDKFNPQNKIRTKVSEFRVRSSWILTAVS